MNHNVWEDGFFKIDPECHIIGDMGPINHFPGVQMCGCVKYRTKKILFFSAEDYLTLPSGSPSTLIIF